MNPVTVTDKVILVTGGLGQIGRVISRAFLLQGAFVVLADLNIEQEELFEIEMATCGVDRRNYLILEVDITNKNSCQQ